MHKIKYLACPVCKKKINNICYCENCNIKFPVIKDIPILINEKNSVFSFDDYKETDAYSFFEKGNKQSFLRKIKPAIGINYEAKNNYLRLFQLLEKINNPLILIIGAGIPGAGMKEFLANPALNFVFSDVSFTSNIHLICDCHDLPFQSNSVDCVVAQAVLEHVVDPYRCIEEIHRVLKEGGIVYAETPFMQQVHGGAYDFTRFTWLGHRRLFRKFKEINSGICCGPGMALAWAWRYFLQSFSENKKITNVLIFFAAWTSFYWKYFDKYLKKKSNSIDAASGNFFIGYKEDNYLLQDKDLIKLYSQKKLNQYHNML